MPREEVSVYVIQLDEAVCQRTDCASRRSGKPHVDIGETKHTPEERFALHRAGGFTARPVVTKHGIRLRPRLYRNWGPYETREQRAMRKQGSPGDSAAWTIASGATA